MIPLYIPSPSISEFHLGPVTIRFYALCLLTGIIAAWWLGSRRWVKRGGTRDAWDTIALWAVVFGIVGARIYHVLTHWGDYFGPGHLNPFAIWEGGIAIFGAVIGGALGAYLAARRTRTRFLGFADAVAPGLSIGQALGRFGNWFNQELFGAPTDLPWGLQIDYPNPAWPVGLPAGTLFHPTFLYEVIWNTMGVIVLLWAGHRFRLQWGRLFAFYLVWYSAGRIVWESIRIDPSEVFFGLRTNVWAAIFGVLVGIVIFAVQTRRHPGFEPSPYMRGRERSGAVQSQNTDEFVDVSAPPTAESIADAATSTVTSK